MANSLYDLSANARKVLIGFLIFCAAVLLLQAISGYQESLKPIGTTPSFYLDANNALGTVPTPPIKGINLDTSRVIQYSLRGFFVKESFPSTAFVYTIEQPRERLAVLEGAQKIAGTLGFGLSGFSDRNKSTNDYEWVNKQGNPTKTLKFNSVLQSWVMETDYINNPEYISAILKGDIPDFTKNAKSLISSLGFLQYKGLSDPYIEVRFGKFDAGNFVEVSKPEDKALAVVNIYRKILLIDLKPSGQQPTTEPGFIKPQAVSGLVFGSDSRNGQIQIRASNSLTNYSKDLFEIKFNNFFYSSKIGVYNIISPEEAWTLVQQAKGFLVNYLPQNGNYFDPFPESVSIQSFTAESQQTELAYFEPETWDGFVYPVYVFRGVAVTGEGKQARLEFFVDALKRTSTK